MKRNIVINSTFLFVIAAILEMTLHECAHLIAAMLVHATPILYHNYVHYNLDGHKPSDAIFCAAAGPLFSLIIGIISQLLLRRQIANPFLRLFALYMAIFGYAGFFGYLGTAPFFAYGDTGFVLRAFNYPPWLIITLAILAVPCLYLIMKRLSKYFVSLMSNDIAADMPKRSKFMLNIVVWPLIIGTVIYTLLNLPVPTTLSLIAPICSPLTILWPYDSYLQGKPANIKYDNTQQLSKRISLPWLFIFIVVIIANRLLVSGLSF